MGKRFCTGCGRAVKGHPGPYGRGKCLLALTAESAAAQAPVASPDNDGAPANGAAWYPHRHQPDPVSISVQPDPPVPSSSVPADVMGPPGPPRLTQVWQHLDARPSGVPRPQPSPGLQWSGQALSPERRREQSCPPVAAQRASHQWLDHHGVNGIYGSQPDLRHQWETPGLPRSQGPSPARPSRGDDYFKQPEAPRGLYRQPPIPDFMNVTSWPAHLTRAPDRRGSCASPPGTEHIDESVKQRALSGEFCDIAELLNVKVSTDTQDFKTFIDSFGNLSMKLVTPRRTISSSFKWLEAWSLYELILCTVYGLDTFQEMCNYRIFMLDLFAKHKLPYVLNYDTKHRQYLGARRSLKFTEIRGDLYLLTFDSMSFKVTRCTKCSSSEHGSSEGPFRAAGQR